MNAEQLPEPVRDIATPGRFRSSIVTLQEEMLKLPQVECPLKHYFANGAYVREVTIPADTLVIGEIHRHECINILLKGEITVITEEGTQRISAPYTFVSKPGIKKAAYTHTDVVWSNVVATESRDVEEIRRQQTVESYDDPAFLAHAQREVLWLSSQQQSQSEPQ